MRKVIGLLLLAVVCLSLTGCGAVISDEKVKAAVEKQGYKDAVLTDKSIFFVAWHGCGKDDDAAYNVQATNALGQRVDLIACVGWPFKGVTVRTK